MREILRFSHRFWHAILVKFSASDTQTLENVAHGKFHKNFTSNFTTPLAERKYEKHFTPHFCRVAALIVMMDFCDLLRNVIRIRMNLRNSLYNASAKNVSKYRSVWVCWADSLCAVSKHHGCPRLTSPRPLGPGNLGTVLSAPAILRIWLFPHHSLKTKHLANPDFRRKPQIFAENCKNPRQTADWRCPLRSEGSKRGWREGGW